MLRFLIAAGLVVLAASSAARAQSCPADCNADTTVAVNELITCVAIVLDGGPATACPACDGNANGVVAINEIIAGVNSALEGCVPAGDRPDLVPVSARFRSETPACITDTSEIRLELEVCIENRGTAASGPFNIAVLGEPFGRMSGLAAGLRDCLRGPFVAFSIDAQADVDGEVAELDEGNNFGTFFIPQPTPPPFCVASATPVATPEATATGETGTPTVEPTATPSNTAPPNPTPTESSTPSAA